MTSKQYMLRREQYVNNSCVLIFLSTKVHFSMYLSYFLILMCNFIYFRVAFHIRYGGLGAADRKIRKQSLSVINPSCNTLHHNWCKINESKK